MAVGVSPVAKGNDGNYLQHCVEVEAAVHLAKAASNRKLHIALTHGMEPFEQLGEPGGNCCLLYSVLCEAAGEPKCNEREIVKAYRASWRSQTYRPDIATLCADLRTEKHYPNSAELLHTVVEKDQLSGGITECNKAKHRELDAAWVGSTIVVAPSSWRKQLEPGDALHCPDRLDVPWLFSMDPMSYRENGDNDDGYLHRSDLDLLVPALRRYVGSGQPGIASLFVYGAGGRRKNTENTQCQFRAFMRELAGCLSIRPHFYAVVHRGGKLNLAGLLFSNEKLAEGFDPPNIEPWHVDV